jgi:hypothetical protein
MESFFSLLQKNVLDRQQWLTRQDLRLAITTWIERTYHRRRRQRLLGKLTPIEYETINRTALTAAYAGAVPYSSRTTPPCWGACPAAANQERGPVYPQPNTNHSVRIRV